MTHPNRLPFEGVLTLVGVSSDKAPSGARGHRVILSHRAALEALPSLLGMAVGYKDDWDGHDVRQKCGVITHAWIAGAKLRVRGYVFVRDFPEFEREPEAPLGMSYEIADALVADMRARVWTLTRATFTGAAILLRDKAAYRRTSFRVVREEQPLAMAAAESLEMRSIVDEEEESGEARADAAEVSCQGKAEGLPAGA